MTYRLVKYTYLDGHVSFDIEEYRYDTMLGDDSFRTFSYWTKAGKIDASFDNYEDARRLYEVLLSGRQSVDVEVLNCDVV